MRPVGKEDAAGRFAFQARYSLRGKGVVNRYPVAVPNRDRVHVIDKASLEIVETRISEPGKTAAHVGFDRCGKKLLLSIGGDGAVIVYTGDTLEELQRIPMRKPSGK